MLEYDCHMDWVSDYPRLAYAHPLPLNCISPPPGADGAAPAAGGGALAISGGLARPELVATVTATVGGRPMSASAEADETNPDKVFGREVPGPDKSRNADAGVSLQSSMTESRRD
jgi:hypothetical protein